jgi:dihydrofolate reductase
MRKIIVSEMVSADGFFAGPNGEIDWHNVDAEFNEAYAIPMLREADMLIFGRVTYDLMASYWPTKESVADDPIVAERMNSLPKIVFSKTRENLEWHGSKLMKEIVPEEILALKKLPGKDIMIFGSGTIVMAFAKLGLIDEYRFVVNPVVLGSGKTLFNGIGKRIKLKFVETKAFGSGNVLLRYR